MLDLVVRAGACTWGVAGAAGRPHCSRRSLSGIGIGLYTLKKFPQLCPKPAALPAGTNRILRASSSTLSVMTSVQQSIMNFGILMVQGLVNSFGTVDHGGLRGGGQDRLLCLHAGAGLRQCVFHLCGPELRRGPDRPHPQGHPQCGPVQSRLFCVVHQRAGVRLCFAARCASSSTRRETAIIAAGVHYLRIEGACYLGIGILFLLYGYYRAVNQPQMSVVLTIASLGHPRGAGLSAVGHARCGVTGIWLSVPIGWALADAIGIGYYLKKHRAKYAVQA